MLLVYYSEAGDNADGKTELSRVFLWEGHRKLELTDAEKHSL
jgi:hypothetical protein